MAKDRQIRPVHVPINSQPVSDDVIPQFEVKVVFDENPSIMTTNFALLFIFSLSQFTYVLSVNCISVQGDISESTQGSLSISKCDNPYTLVSCGFKSSDSNQWFVQGSYIANGQCHAANPKSSAGVYAIARCCDLSPYNIECDTFQSGPVTPDLTQPDPLDDQATNITCPESNNYQILGCTGHTGKNGSFDGAHSSNTDHWTWSQSPNTAYNTDNIC